MMGWIKAAWGIGKGLYSAYKAWFIIVPLVALLGGAFLYVRNAERNQERLAVALAEKSQAVQSAIFNSRALEECVAANEANALDALLQRGRAEAAERNAEKLLNEANSDVDKINREADTLRSRALGCPAIDGDFRRWLLNDSP